MSKPLRILIVEDSADDAQLAIRALARGGFAPAWERVDTAAAMKEALARGGWDAVLADHAIPGFGGMQALELLKASGLDVPFIVVSGTIGEELAVTAMKAGASDYVLKENLARLPAALAREQREARNRAAARRAAEALREQQELLALLADSIPAMIAYLDAQHRFRYANLRYRQFYGGADAPIEGRAAEEVFTPETWAQVRERVERALAGEAQSYEGERRLHDGTTGYVSVALVPHRDASGKVRGIYTLALDITRQHSAEAALRESDERFRSLTELSSDFYWEQDEQFRFVERTGGASEKKLYPRELVLGRTRWELPALNLTAADWAEHRADLEAHREFRNLEIERPDASGAPRWISVSGRPIFDARGTFRGYRGIGVDITARKLAELSLRETSERLRMLVESSPLAIYTRDPGGLLTSWNAAAERMFGWKAAEVLGKPLPSVPDDARAESDAIRRRLLAGETFLQYRGERRRRDGSAIFIDSFLAPLRDAAGAATGIIAVVADETERIRAEEAVRKAEMMYRVIFDNAVEGIFLVDPRGRVVSSSPALARMLGYGSPQEMMAEVSSVARQVYADPDARARFRAELAAHGAVEGFETRWRRRDGGTFWVSLTGRVIEKETGGAIHHLGMARDVSAHRAAEAALAASESLKRSILEASLDAIVTMDAEGRVVEFNPAAERTFGYARAQALGRPVGELIVPPKVREPHSRALARVRAGGEPRILGRRVEMQAMRADGSEFPAELAVTAIPSQAAPLYAGFIRDITERRNAEARIRGLNRVYAVLSGINGLIVRATDRDGLLRDACRLAVEDGGFRMAWIGLVDAAAQRVVPLAWHGTGPDYIGLMPLGLAEGPPAVYGLAGRAVNEARAQVSDDISRDPRVLLKSEAAERRLCSLAVLPLVRAGKATGVLALYSSETGFFDAQEMQLLEELAGDVAFALDHLEKAAKVQYLAYYDSLTGLANRTLLLERLAQRLAAAAGAGHGAALALVNIDRFKSLNDAFGRPVGDALLKAVGARLVELAGDAGNLARVGADQFAVLVPRVRSEGALAARLREANRRVDAEPYRIAGHELRISTRAGVAIYPEDGADAEALFRNAEAALKSARAGEAFLFYTARMTERVAERLAMENELRRALERGEFVLHYQPRVALATRRVAGMEALIRWQSPERGLVPPGEFVSLLEETGMILEAGAWALGRAARDHRAWTEAKLRPPRVAVNVSAIQLRQRDFVERVQAAVMEGVAPVGIDLEITESLVMQDLEATIRKLQELRGLGLRIAVDDFGTGYSSLAYLARLPIETLKIDRSFVRRMLEDASSMTIVQTIVSLAHSLRLKVVAEGVETEEQAAALLAAGCDEMQGFLFSHPVPFAEMSALLAQEQQRESR